MTTILSITALLLAAIVLVLKFKSLFTATIRSLDYIRKYFYVINDNRFIAEFSRLRGYIFVFRNLKGVFAGAYLLSVFSVFFLFFRHSQFVLPGVILSYSLLGIVALLNLADHLLYRYITTLFDNIFSGNTSKYAPTI